MCTDCVGGLSPVCYKSNRLGSCPHEPFTTEDVSIFFGVCSQTLQKWARKNGKVKSLGKNHIYSWTISNIKEFQNRNKRGIKNSARKNFPSELAAESVVD